MTNRKKRKAKIRKRNSLKVNKAPGTLKYTGEEECPTEISFYEYDSESMEIRDIDSLDNLVLKDNGKVKWLDIIGLNDEGMVEKLGKKFNIHFLLLEDILDISHRPKLEYDNDLIFIIGKLLDYNKETKELQTKQISFILTKDILITLRETDNPIFDNTVKRLNAGRNIRNKKKDYLFYSLLDALVDSYFIVLEDIDEELDDLEDDLMEDPDKELLHNIYEIKRETLYIRNLIWPLRNILGSLTKEELNLISNETTYYLRDIHDHIIQIIDIIETYRDILSGMLDTYLSSIGNKTNDVMKILTIFATIFTPITFLTSWYGMNFPNMPAFTHENGYFIFVGLSILVGILTFTYLKKKDWMN